jgi:hypothetical protein
VSVDLKREKINKIQSGQPKALCSAVPQVVEAIRQKGARVVIPPRSRRKTRRRYDYSILSKATAISARLLATGLS